MKADIDFEKKRIAIDDFEQSSVVRVWCLREIAKFRWVLLEIGADEFAHIRRYHAGFNLVEVFVGNSEFEVGVFGHGVLFLSGTMPDRNNTPAQDSIVNWLHTGDLAFVFFHHPLIFVNQRTDVITFARKVSNAKYGVIKNQSDKQRRSGGGIRCDQAKKKFKLCVSRESNPSSNHPPYF